MSNKQAMTLLGLTIVAVP